MRQCAQSTSERCNNLAVFGWLRNRLARRRIVHGEGFGVGFLADATPEEQEEFVRSAVRRNFERRGETVDEAKIDEQARRLLDGKARGEAFLRDQQAQREGESQA